MDVAVIQDDEIENEFQLNLCCASCALEVYGWSEAQFQMVRTSVKEKKPISIPSTISTVEQFINHIKSV